MPFFICHIYDCSVWGWPKNFGQSLANGYSHTLYSPKSYRPSIRTIPLCALVFPHFRQKFWVGVVNLQSRGMGP